MGDPRDKHTLAKIPLKRRAAPPAAPARQAPRDPGAPAAPPPDPPPATPPGDELDAVFDRSFEETFAPTGGPPQPARRPSPVPSSSESLPEIEVDVEPAAPAPEPPPAAPAARLSARPSRAPEAGTGAAAEVLRTLAADAGVPALDLDRITIDLSALAYVPRDVAVRNLLLPVLADDERIVLAMADPGQRRILEEVEFVTGRRLVPHVAMHAQLRRYIDTCYRARLAGERVYAAPDAAPLGALDAGRVSGEPRAPEPAGPGPVDLLEDESGLRPIDLDSQPLAPAAARARQTPVPGEPRRKKVLVVDDESDIRMLISRVLRDRGYEVVEAAHGADALRAVQNLVPDLLVLDAMLPEIHGFDVCRRIKRSPRYAHIPVIMISAVYRGWRFASDLRTSYGVDAFLEKPFKIADLADRVGELLSGTPREQAAPSRDLSAAAQAELAAGIRCCREGDIDGAIRHVKAGLDADPLSAQLHYQLGVLHGKQGKVYQAIHEMEQALEIEPGDFATLRNLGQLYEHAGFRCKAVEMWERAASASTDEVARSSIKEHLLKLL